MHSWYLQENISSKAHKHIHPGHHDQKDRLQTRKPGYLLQAHPVYHQHCFVTQGVFSKNTLYISRIAL